MIRALHHDWPVYAACCVALTLGLFFIFAWSPLPWGWHGIDFYYEIALGLARGEPFPTMNIVWGYPFFLAFWYRLFGDHPWIPLVVQAVLNASVPLLLYQLVRIEIDRRVAVASAAIAGAFSVSTVYASTQASDSVCTVLFVATVLCFAIGRARRSLVWFALSGVLAGATFQCRPNFGLFPFFAGGLYVWLPPRASVRLVRVSVFLAAFLAASAPWVIRNYRWSGLFVPATTHGGVQFWSGTLQVGAYQDSWLYNPRAAFENPPVEYSSIDELPLIASGNVQACSPADARVELIYWTNRDPRPVRVVGMPDPRRDVTISIPRQVSPTTVFYYFEVSAFRDGRTVRQQTPPDGASQPSIVIVSRDHLGDLDAHGDWLDVFDIVRLARHLYWNEPLPAAGPLDMDRNGRIDSHDLSLAIALLADLTRSPLETDTDVVSGVRQGGQAVTLRLNDGSSVTIPRSWQGRITDLDVRGPIAASLVSRSRTFQSLAVRRDARPARGEPCLALDRVAVNRVPMRREPHEMRRYVALAVDNIRAAPLRYLEASASRALRLFIVKGSRDWQTAVQFRRSAAIYAIAEAASVVYFGLFLVGVAIAFRRRYPVFLLLTPIAYVPATIAPMLVTARYTTTIQPFAFAFVAIAYAAVVDRRRASRAGVITSALE